MKNTTYPSPSFEPPFFSGQIVLGVLHSTNCVLYYANGVQAILYALHCLVYNVLNSVIYCALIAKSNHMAELIEYFQMVVNERMCPSTVFRPMTILWCGSSHLFIHFQIRVQAVKCIESHLYEARVLRQANRTAHCRDDVLLAILFLYTIGVVLAIDTHFWCSIDGILDRTTCYWRCVSTNVEQFPLETLKFSIWNLILSIISSKGFQWT